MTSTELILKQLRSIQPTSTGLYPADVDGVLKRAIAEIEALDRKLAAATDDRRWQIIAASVAGQSANPTERSISRVALEQADAVLDLVFAKAAAP